MGDCVPPPLLTIVTVNKNNANGLRRTILSILPILSGKVHYLVMDGASEDASLDVARSLLAGHKHASIVSERDSGIYQAMNKGWQQSRSEYVAYINSGDEIVQDAYTRLVSALESRAADIFYARLLLACAGVADLVTHERHPEQFKSDTLPHPATVVRRSTFDRLGGFDQRFRIAADRDFFIRAQKEGFSFLHVPEAVAVFYLGGASAGWRAGLESAAISRRHGYIGFWGWLGRVAWSRLTRSSLMTEERVFRLLQRWRGLAASARRIIR
ncbi:glycosyltransferase [uncultured Aquabacterium sp.]|uniref:glycosyltransferase n=1 Tax=uncultured Aquabacterium sp. TaxID=158753 RepID=UPI00262F9F2F|nr:glycosyltransferase [uncultured Aquabacterium sp.]